MKIDFSALNNMAQTKAPTMLLEATRTDSEQKGIEISIEDVKRAVNANMKPTEPIESMGSKALISLRHEQEDHKRTAAIFGMYQENTKKAERLQCEILKGSQNGEDARELLLKAVECIARMTDNTAFYNQFKLNMEK